MTKAHERASRIRAIQALQNLHEFVENTIACVGRTDGLHDAVDVEELEVLASRAMELAREHARDYGTLAVLEGGQRG